MKNIIETQLTIFQNLKRVVQVLFLSVLVTGVFIETCYAQKRTTKTTQSNPKQTPTKNTQKKPSASELAVLNQNLLTAAQQGDLETVKTLLAKGASVNAKDKKKQTLGVTPLMFASAYGHIPVVQLLLDKKADVNAESKKTKLTSLSLASAQGHLSIVENLIAKGALAKDAVSEKSVSNEIPIMYAACGREFATKDQSAILRILFQKSFKVNKYIELRTLVFVLAVLCGHIDLLDILKPEILTKDSAAPLVWLHTLLTAFEFKEIIVSTLYDFGLTDIWVAAKRGDLAEIEELLAQGSDINALNKNFLTPLIEATYKSNTETVRLLLKRGADVNVKTQNGKTVLDIAKELKDSEAKNEIIKLLEVAGAKK